MNETQSDGRVARSDLAVPSPSEVESRRARQSKMASDAAAASSSSKANGLAKETQKEQVNSSGIPAAPFIVRSHFCAITCFFLHVDRDLGCTD